MKDKISIERAEKLQPKMKERVYKFFDALEAQGLLPRISQGLRTNEEQNALYAQGRTKAGKIVTNAKGGQSWHNYGLAIDLCFLNPDNTVTFTVSKEIGKLGEKLGLDWGGDWTQFPDNPHFQIPGLPDNPQYWTSEQLNTHLKSLPSMTPTPEIQLQEWEKVALEYANKAIGFKKENPRTPMTRVEVAETMRKFEEYIKSRYSLK